MDRFGNGRDGDQNQIDEVQPHDQAVERTMVIRCGIAVKDQAGARGGKDQDDREEHRSTGDGEKPPAAEVSALEPDFRKQKPDIADHRLARNADGIQYAAHLIRDGEETARGQFPQAVIDKIQSKDDKQEFEQVDLQRACEIIPGVKVEDGSAQETAQVDDQIICCSKGHPAPLS